MLLLFLLIGVWGCRRPEGLVLSSQPEGPFRIKRIALLPFEALPAGPGRETVVTCPLCGSIFTTGPIAEDASATLSELFFHRLRQLQRFDIIDSSDAAEVYRRVVSSGTGPLATKLQQVGMGLGVEGVFFGHIYRYSERRGTRYMADRPASVAYDVHLIRVEDGRMVWWASFDRTQKSLLENLLQLPSFLKLGGRWVTAGELADLGLEEMLQSLPAAEKR